jgi:hypothetical protein
MYITCTEENRDLTVTHGKGREIDNLKQLKYRWPGKHGNSCQDKENLRVCR